MCSCRATASSHTNAQTHTQAPTQSLPVCACVYVCLSVLSVCLPACLPACLSPSPPPSLLPLVAGWRTKLFDEQKLDAAVGLGSLDIRDLLGIIEGNLWLSNDLQRVLAKPDPALAQGLLDNVAHSETASPLQQRLAAVGVVPGTCMGSEDGGEGCGGWCGGWCALVNKSKAGRVALTHKSIPSSFLRYGQTFEQSSAVTQGITVSVRVRVRVREGGRGRGRDRESVCVNVRVCECARVRVSV